tara:strand:- start:78 stop:305 length:228 start_codon:yes stop_codon:yes gene_type:complete
MGNVLSKETDLTLQFQIWNMKRKYILERAIATKSLIGRCAMAEYGFSCDELMPVYKAYLSKDYGATHYLFNFDNL